MKARRAGVLVAVLGLSVLAGARELSLSVAAGGFTASGEAYRRVYGSSVPYAVDVWLKFKGSFGLAAGYGRVGDKGNAVPLGEDGLEYPVKFGRTSIPIVLFYEIGLKAVDVRVGAGLCVHRYVERWETVGLRFEGHKTSPRFIVTASARILGGLSIVGSAAYDTIPTGEGSPLADGVNLGGFQFLGGISFRIF